MSYIHSILITTRAEQGLNHRGLIFLRGFEVFVNYKAGVADNASQVQRDLYSGISATKIITEYLDWSA